MQTRISPASSESDILAACRTRGVQHGQWLLAHPAGSATDIANARAGRGFRGDSTAVSSIWDEARLDRRPNLQTEEACAAFDAMCMAALRAGAQEGVGPG